MNDKTKKTKSAGRLAWYLLTPTSSWTKVTGQGRHASKADAHKWLKTNTVNGEFMLVREVERYRMVIPPRPAPVMQGIPLDGVTLEDEAAALA